MPKRRFLGAGLTAISAVGFGTLGFFVKTLFEQGMSLANVLMLRFIVATILLWSYLFIRGDWRVTAKTAWTYILLGVFGYTIQASFFFLALAQLKSGLANILLYLYPAIVALLDGLLYRKRPTQPQIAALAAVSVGCMLVVDLKDVSLTWLGVTAGIGAAFWYALYLIVSERVIAGVRAEVASGYIFLGACLTFTTYACAFDSQSLLGSGMLSPTTLGFGFAVAIFATVIPVVTLFAGIKEIGTVKASIICTVEPIVTVILGYLLLGEHLLPLQLGGIALILAAIVWLRLNELKEAGLPIP